MLFLGLAESKCANFRILIYYIQQINEPTEI